MASIFPNVALPDNATHIEHEDAINPDIRDSLEKYLPIATDEVKRIGIAPYFKGKDCHATAKNIWDYERTYVTYLKDTEELQDIRMPRRFHHDRDGDCKTFAINALAIYKAIYPNLPVAFKYTAYNSGAKIPSHVYAVVKGHDGKNIIIDGCYNFFNQEKEYSFALPLKWDMKVRILSDNTGLARLPESFDEMYDRASPANKQRIKQVMQAEMQVHQLQGDYESGKIDGNTYLSGLNEVENCLGATKPHKVKKHTAGQNALHWLDIATLAIGRGAYDALVALNFMAMADKLAILYDKYPAQWKKVARVYYELGGYEKALMKAYKIGVKHRPFFLSKKSREKYEAKFGNDARQLGLKLPKGYAGLEDGLDAWVSERTDTAIGVVAAATASTAAPVLAAILAAIGKAFHSAGDTQHETDVQSSASDLVSSAQPGGVMDPAQAAIPTSLPPVPAGTPPINETDTPATDIPDPAAGLFTGQALGSFWDDIGGALGSLFHAGMNKLKDKLDSNAKVNPALKQLGNAGIDAAGYLTGQTLHAATGALQGYTQKLEPQTEPTKHYQPVPQGFMGFTQQQVIIGGALAFGVYLLSQQKGK